MKGQAITTSLKVAKVFEKRHDRVLRAIENAISTLPKNGDSEKCFIKSSYTDSTGKSNPMYYLNRDGFAFVAMGFTGQKAAEFKWKYIQAFNKMEKALLERQSPTWQNVRQSSKETNKEMARAIHEILIPIARANGSETFFSIHYLIYQF